MNASDSVRIDKFLWAVRLFKTRSMATEECKKGRVMMGGMPVKSSRMVKKGDEISLKVAPVYRTYKVIDVSDKRMGAPLTASFIVDITPADQLEMLELTRMANKLNRARGLGRPTKKDRRDMSSFLDDGPDDDPDSASQES
jgi:ribosome-associated heat shock protein Hsp15